MRISGVAPAMPAIWPESSFTGSFDAANTLATAAKKSACLMTSSLLRRFFRAHSAEDVAHGVVTFVAGILEELVVIVLFELHQNGPRLGPGLLVDDGDPVIHGLVAGAGKSLDDLELVAVIPRVAWISGAVRADGVLVGEIRGLHDQIITFPAAARIAHHHFDIGADVRTPVERNHAALVDHFVAEDNVAGTLHDLVPVVVHHRNHGSQKTARDAAVIDI